MAIQKRKSFKSETVRLASTSVDTAASIGKAIGSTADVVTNINEQLITPILGSTGEYIKDILKADPSEEALEFYEDNLDMYKTLYGEKDGLKKLRDKVEEIQKGKEIQEVKTASKSKKTQTNKKKKA